MITNRYRFGTVREHPRQLGWISWLRSFVSRLAGDWLSDLRLAMVEDCSGHRCDCHCNACTSEPWCRDCGSDELRCRCLPGSE